MAIVDMVMPKMGESIMEATILKWLKQPGDHINADESVLEIATDKVDSEVPSTTSGTLQEILYQPNEVVPVGTVIARIRTETAESTGSTYVHTPPNRQQDQKQEQPFTPVQEVQTSFAERPSAKMSMNGNRFYSPLVLNIAAREGISMSELEKIPGTGNEGRVTKRDILQYINQRKSGTYQRTSSPSVTRDAESSTGSFVQKERYDLQTTSGQLQTSSSGNVEIIELDRMRKLIAKYMVESIHTSAHVTSFAEADVTNMVMWRNRIKNEFEKRENEKITFTPLFIEAIVKCIKKYPWLNSSLEGERLIVKKDINVGMATALPSGNLIVPVIKNADQLNLVGLTRQVNILANAARNNKLRPDDTTGGTFTLTNVGSFGSIMGTPIINQPQVAILATGAIKKRPVVIETEQGDSIAIRHMIYLSMSYDHRIIDGALGATFLSTVAKELENFDPNREF